MWKKESVAQVMEVIGFEPEVIQKLITNGKMKKEQLQLENL